MIAPYTIDIAAIGNIEQSAWLNLHRFAGIVLQRRIIKRCRSCHKFLFRTLLFWYCCCCSFGYHHNWCCFAFFLLLFYIILRWRRCNRSHQITPFFWLITMVSYRVSTAVVVAMVFFSRFNQPSCFLQQQERISILIMSLGWLTEVC